MNDSTRTHLVANRYRLIRKLGEGGMGVVYLAKDALEESDQRLALKFLPATANPGRIEQFKKEFLLLTKLEHVHLARVYDLGFDRKRKQLFFTSDYVEGDDLFKSTRGKKLEELYPLFGELLQVLSYIHRQGVVHNDLKPSNILVSAGHVKLLDFGISTLGSSEIAGKQSFYGTPGYLAPEVIRGEHGTVVSDLFSLGIVIFKVLTGQMPFDGSRTDEIFARTLAGRIPNLRDFRADLPERLESFVSQLTAAYPAQRPVSAEQALQTLGQISKRPFLADKKERRETFLQSSAFIGREEPMDRVLTILERTFQGGESTADKFLQVIGTVGMGKSRFLRELGYHLQLRDIAFCNGQCRKHKTGVYQPWDDLFRQMQGFIENLPDEFGFSMQTLHAVLFGDARKEKGSETEQSADERFRFFHAYATLINSIAKNTSLVIVLDNLEDADRDSLNLFSYLLRSCRSNVVFIAAYLPGGEESLQTFCLQFGGERLEMSPLAPGDIRTFVCSMLARRDLPNGFAERLQELSGGSPARLQELIKDFVARKLLKRVQSTWKVPDDVISKLKHYAPSEQKWNEQQNDLFSCCAIFPSTFSLREVALLLGELPQKIARELEQKAEEGIFLRVGADGYEWAQPGLHRQFLEKMLQKSRSRKELEEFHRRLAKSLIASGKEVVRLADMERAAYHFQSAGEKLLAAQWSLETAKRHLEKWALDRAERSLLFTKECLGALSDADQGEFRMCLIELYLRQGRDAEALALLQSQIAREKLDGNIKSECYLDMVGIYQRRGEYQQGLKIAKESLPFVAREGGKLLHARILAQWALLEGHLGNKDAALAKIEEALSLLGEQEYPIRYAYLRNIQGTMQMNYAQNFPKAAKSLEEAWRIFNNLQDRRGLAIVSHNLGLVYGRLGKTDREEEFFQKALAFSRELGDIRRTLPCLNSLGNLHVRRAQILQARGDYQEALELSRLLQDRLMEASLLYNLGRVDHLQAHFESGVLNCRKGVEISHALGNTRSEAYGLLTLAALLLSLGRLQDAHDSIKRAEALSKGLKDQLLLATVSLLQGELLGLRGSYEKAKEVLLEAKRVYEKVGLQSQALECDCSMARNDMWAKKTGETITSEALNAAIKHFEAEKSRIQILNSRLLDWEHQLALGKTGTMAKMQAFDRDDAFALQMLPETWIDFKRLQAQFYRQEKKPLQVLAVLEEAEQRIMEIAGRLTPENRQIYLDDMRRKHILSMLDEERSKESSLKVELVRLRAELETKGKLLDFYFELVQSAHKMSDLLKMILEKVGELSSAKKAAFYLQESKGLDLKKSILLGESKDWVMEISLDEKLKKFGEDMLANGTAGMMNKYFVLPFYQEEQLPLGLLVLGEAEPSQEEKRMLQLFVRFAAALIAREIKVSELIRKSESTSTELTLARRTLQEQQRTLKLEHNYDRIIGGRSPAMVAVFQMLDKVIPSLASVLIQGESGTGKELIAQAIHYNGPLADQPLVSINCGAISPQILESQLFGHVKGAFTGAVGDQLGLLVQANGGTVFFDEIGEMPLDMQVKLLRVLQEGEVRPVGSAVTLKAKFRVVAATNRNLEKLVEEGSFRKDLFYRLNVIMLSVPPLRERREDIPYLTEHFLKKLGERSGKPRKTITSRALKALTYATWPGNVRQLENSLEMIATLTESRRIDVADLPPELQGQKPGRVLLPVEKAKREFMKAYLEDLLDRTGGRVAEAARLAGIHRESFHRLMRKNL